MDLPLPLCPAVVAGFYGFECEGPVGLMGLGSIFPYRRQSRGGRWKGWDFFANRFSLRTTQFKYKWCN